MATDPPAHDPKTGELEEEPVVRPFNDFLMDHANGKTHGELSEALQKLVAGVRDTGKAGKLQLTISITPMKKASNGVLMVSDVIKVSVPAHDRKDSLFYPDEHGNLTRTDPNQLTFETLREVPEPTKTIKAVPDKEKRA